MSVCLNFVGMNMKAEIVLRTDEMSYRYAAYKDRMHLSINHIL